MRCDSAGFPHSSQVAESTSVTGGRTTLRTYPRSPKTQPPRQTHSLSEPPNPKLQRAPMAAQEIADAVQAYTGLSPAAAFTVLALMLATYLIVSTLFVAPDSAASAPAAHPKPPQQQEQGTESEPEPFVPPFPDPVQVGEITLEQLRAYDGKDPAKSILIAIRGQVYDVSRGR